MMLQLLFADDDSPACSQAMFHLLFAGDVSPAVRRRCFTCCSQTMFHLLFAGYTQGFPGEYAINSYNWARVCMRSMEL